MENSEKKMSLSDLLSTTMSKIHEMVNSNVIVGEPIRTPDGVTVIPISRVSFGFGTGGTDYGKAVDKFGGAGVGGVRIEPASFLIVKDGVTRVVPVAPPPVGALDRVVDLVPEIMDRVDRISERKHAGEAYGTLRKPDEKSE